MGVQIQSNKHVEDIFSTAHVLNTHVSSKPIAIRSFFSPLSPQGCAMQSWQLLDAASDVLKNWCLELRRGTLRPHQANRAF